MTGQLPLFLSVIGFNWKHLFGFYICFSPVMEYSTESYFAGVLFPCLPISLESRDLMSVLHMVIISLIMKVRAPKEEFKFQIKIRDGRKVNP